MSILVSIVKAPEWARPAGADLSVEGPPADPATYASFVGEFAARYCGRVQAIEVWNEQNLHYEWGDEPLDARRYVPVAGRGLSGHQGSVPEHDRGERRSDADRSDHLRRPSGTSAYLEQMYQRRIEELQRRHRRPSQWLRQPAGCSCAGWAGRQVRPGSHVSDPSFYFRNMMEQYRNIMVKYGDGSKRLWPTEFGWASTSSPVAGYEYATYNSEQAQGDYIIRAFEMMRDWGWVGVPFLWNLDYNNTQPGSRTGRLRHHGPAGLWYPAGNAEIAKKTIAFDLHGDARS